MRSRAGGRKPARLLREEPARRGGADGQQLWASWQRLDLAAAGVETGGGGAGRGERNEIDFFFPLCGNDSRLKRMEQPAVAIRW